MVVTNSLPRRARAVAYACCTMASVPAGVAAQRLDSAAVARTITDEMAAGGVPGAAIAVVADGRVVFEQAFGVASIETGAALRPDMLFRLGSTTKMLTGALAALLAAEGVVSLTAPVGKYASDIPAPFRRLTLDRLLTHTAGLADAGAEHGYHNDADLGAAIRRWGSDKILGPVGEVQSYASPGYWLAGYVLERAAGKPYADLISEKLFLPLGMHRTMFRPVMALTYPLAQGHDGPPGKTAKVARPLRDDARTWPSGSVFATVGDFARFAIALLDSGRVGGTERFPLSVTTRMFGGGAPMPGAGDCQYTFGLASCTFRGVRTFTHFGFRNGYGSLVTFVPASRVAVIIAGNRTGAILSKTADTVLAMLRPLGPPDSPAEPSGKPLTVSERGSFAGVYVNGSDTLRLIERGDSLVALRYGTESAVSRSAEGLLLQGGSGEPSPLLLLERGAARYLHDGLHALRRVGPSRSRVGGSRN